MEIFKIQKSLTSSDGKTRVLVYNKDRSIMFEEDWDPALDLLLARTKTPGKIYVEATCRPGNRFEIFQQTTEQDW